MTDRPKDDPSLWRRTDIESTKAEVKAELDAIGEASGNEARLRYALSRIEGLEEEDNRLGRLRRFVYTVSALVHHLHHGGLDARAIRTLAELAGALLKIQGITPTSTLSSLYGDLHLTLSQIHRKEGHQWSAMWEHLTSFYLSQRDPSGGQGFQALSLGHHAIRLGLTRLALSQFEHAESGALPDSLRNRARLERIKTLRLMGRSDEAEPLSREALQSGTLDAAETLELKWEALCRRVQRDGDVSTLVAAVGPKGSHREPGYIIQAYAWTRATATRDWLTRFPTLGLFGRRANLRRHPSTETVLCTKALDAIHDSSVPYDIRLTRLGKMLSQAKRLPTLDWELLSWACGARWLSRNRTSRHALVATERFRALSLQASEGKSADMLGVLGDLIDARSEEEPIRDAG